MSQIGSVGSSDILQRALLPQPQQPSPQQPPFQPLTTTSQLGASGTLDLKELESKAQSVRGGSVAQANPQSDSPSRNKPTYPWPLRVFRQSANVQQDPPPQSDQPQNQQASPGSRIDLMA